MAVTSSEIRLPELAARQAEPATHARIIIFAASLVLKGVASTLFFGSVDVFNSARNSLALLGGGIVHLPYLPTVNAFLWFGGVLSAALPVPFPLSLKLVPILFDSLLAVLIYDLVRRSAPQLAVRTGLLYALNPVTLLIISSHGQWDCIALFFLLLAFGILQGSRADWRKELLFGGLFGVSLLVKPIALPFLLLFPTRKRGGWLLDWPALTGSTAVLGAACVVYWGFGYSPFFALMAILHYSATGVQVLGLPLSPLLSRFAIEDYRLYWVVPAMIALAELHRRGKVTATDAMLLFYLYCVGTTGLSPQYLLWPLPFLMVTRRLRLAALYTGVATGFLLMYYANPWASYWAFENLGAFAPLRGLGWLLPPAALAERELLPVIHFLGNVVFPVCALVVAALVWKSRGSQVVERLDGAARFPWSLSDAIWYAGPPFLLGAVILLSKLTVDVNRLHARLAHIWNALPGQYAMQVQWLESRVIVARDSGTFASLNVVVLLAVFAVAWCVIATRAKARA